MDKFPKASIILITYNHERFIKESLYSVLNQTYPNLEIIVADDCSSDNTRAIIKAILNQYQGKHKVILSHNDVNLGICGNINQALKKTSGEIIFPAAGDDVSDTRRCEIVVNKWLELNKVPGLIATDSFDMSIDGQILGIQKTSPLEKYTGIEDWIKSPPYFVGCNHSWSKALLDKFPPLNQNLLAEDHIMVFRAIISDGAITIPDPLVKHRRGGVTTKKVMTLEEKILKLRRNFPDKKIFIQEIIRDSSFVNYQDKMQTYYQNSLAECDYAEKMLQVGGFFSKVCTTLRVKNVSLKFKTRLITYGCFPFLLMPLFALKKIFRKIN